MKKQIKHHSITVLVVLAVLLVGATFFIYSGLYNIGADDHHTKPVFTVLQTLRDRSIHVRSDDIKVPNLEDPQLILKGAGQYAAMCTDCHLAPGKTTSEIRPGLYPQPPNLSQARFNPQDEFWVIKHGLKMSAMPAWGFSHDDPAIWSMVAFLQKLPDMTPQQYKDIVAKAPPDEDMDMGEEGGHSHGDAADEDAHGAGMDRSGEASHSHGTAEPESHEHADATSKAEAPLSLDGMQPKAAPQAEAAAQAFHAALQRGDRTAALALLAPAVTISEGGHTQSRDAYASGHLAEDIAFLKSAKITPVSLGSMPMGDTAMVGSESDLATTAEGKPDTIRSRELLTLKKIGPAWKITAIQWQSEPVPGASRKS